VTAPLRLACLASGGGRTILNLLDRIEDDTVPASIETVLTSRSGTRAAARCRDRGLSVKEPPPGVDVDHWVLQELEQASPDLVCLCGYLRLLPMAPWLLHRVINIHPALLPDFGGKGMYGKAVHEAVIASGRRQSGCTVHLVDAEYDHGPTIVQRRCNVNPDDDAAALAARVFEEECIAVPEAVSLIAAGRVRVFEGPVQIAPEGQRWPNAIPPPH